MYRLAAVPPSTALDEPPAASDPTPSGWRAGGRWYLTCLGIVLLGFALRAAFYQKGYTYPDEPITREVVRHMLQSGDFDTNWAKADLEPHFRYDQYNFSSYLEATFFFRRIVNLLAGLEAWRSANAGLLVYRFFSVVLGGLAVWQTLRLGLRAGGRTVGLIAGVLAAVAVLLVQDAHYARPEAFETVLTLAVVTLCWPRKHLAVAAALGAAFLVGVLAACKVTMLLLAWLPLVPLLTAGAEPRRPWLVLSTLPLLLFAGFVVGAPGAVAHPSFFLNGVHALTTQYGGVQGPHSHLSGAAVVDMQARYFGATLGLPLLSCFMLGVIVLTRKRRWAELALLVAPVVSFFGLFAMQSVFYERNLSHVLPLLLVVAALGAADLAAWIARASGMPRAMIAALLAVLLAARSVTLSASLLGTALSGRGSERRVQLEAELRARHPGVAWWEVRFMTPAALDEVAARFRTGNAPLLMRVADYRDEPSGHYLRLFIELFDARLVGNDEGAFPDIPTSTLLTYHSPHESYFLVLGPR
jgi:hypothetical protein